MWIEQFVLLLKIIYIYIGYGAYGGAFGGGIQQNVDGFVTLNSCNASGNTKVLRCC